MAATPEDPVSKPPEDGEAAHPKDEKVPLVVPLIIAASFFMEGLDTSIINTSLPQMAAQALLTRTSPLTGSSRSTCSHTI